MLDGEDSKKKLKKYFFDRVRDDIVRINMEWLPENLRTKIEEIELRNFYKELKQKYNK